MILNAETVLLAAIIILAPVCIVLCLKIKRLVNERSRAESELKKEKNKAEKYFDTADVMIVEINSDKTVDRINRKGMEVLECSENDIVGQNWFDLFVPENIREDEECIFNEIMGGDTELKQSFQSNLLSMSGNKLIISWHRTLTADEDGKITGMLSSGEDITRRKQAEMELHRALSEYRETAEMLAMRNTEIDENREEIQGALDEVSSLIKRVEDEKNTNIRFHNPNLTKCYEEMNCKKTDCPCYERGKTRCWQITGTYCGGTVQGTFAQKYGSCSECSVFMNVTRDPIYRIGEHFNNMMHVVEKKRAELEQEIAVRKRAEQKQEVLLEEIHHINQELNDFAYVVSHDLKAPLRAIGSLANWISSDYMDKLDEDGKEQLNLLTGRVKRMHGLIDGILQYSRVGRIREDKTDVDLNMLVPDVIDAIAPPQNINVTVENELPTIVCEGTRMEQVFQNLLSNAIKYMDKPSGAVSIGCIGENGHWKFHVSDNGPGIDEKYFDKIFHIFQTLNPRDEYESTGVGLTLVKKIVEMYGGKLWIESEIGKGCQFYFTIPRETTGVVC